MNKKQYIGISVAAIVVIAVVITVIVAVTGGDKEKQAEQDATIEIEKINDANESVFTDEVEDNSDDSMETAIIGMDGEVVNIYNEKDYEGTSNDSSTTGNEVDSSNNGSSSGKKKNSTNSSSNTVDSKSGGAIETPILGGDSIDTELPTSGEVDKTVDETSGNTKPTVSESDSPARNETSDSQNGADKPTEREPVDAYDASQGKVFETERIPIR